MHEKVSRFGSVTLADKQVKTCSNDGSELMDSSILTKGPRPVTNPQAALPHSIQRRSSPGRTRCCGMRRRVPVLPYRSARHSVTVAEY
jgi:hypothetical protein